MDIKQINQKINGFINNLGPMIKGFPSKFKRMTLGEQIAYGCIALGGILIIVSLFLF